MADEDTLSTEFNKAMLESGDKNLRLISLVYLGSIIISPLVFVGVIMAYMFRKDAPEWAQDNYVYAIRTFWITLLFFILGIVLLIFVIGFLVLILAWVMFVVRSIKLYQYSGKVQTIEKPKSWLW